MQEIKEKSAAQISRIVGVSFFLYSSLWHGSLLAAPAGYPVGDSEIVPQLRVEYFGDDNAFATSQNAEDETGVRVKPIVEWVADKGLTRLVGSYRGEYSTSGVSETDYNDHQIGFTGSTEFTKRSRAGVSFTYGRIAEKPGTGLSGNNNLILEELSVTDDLQLGVRHVYGSQNARGNLETGLRFRDFSYSNNEGITRSSNYTDLTPYGLFSLRVGGSTRATLELRYRTFDYEIDTGDREQLDILVGAQWAESSKFGGRASVGVIDHSSDNPLREDGTELGIEIGGYYQPVSFSRFDLELDRSLYNINDSTDSSSTSASISDTLSIIWRHEWSRRLISRANVSREAIERDCSSDSDVIIDAGAELQLNIKRWLGVGAGIETVSRQFDGCSIGGSLVGERDYDRQIYTLFLNITL